MRISEIVRRVRSAIDELTANEAGFPNESDDKGNLETVIKDKIGYALQHVLEHVPLRHLDADYLETLTTEELSQDFSIDAETMVVTLELPGDMLRIVEARLSSWSHFPTPESDTSQVYLMQQDEYARGSYDRPVNILTYEGGGRVLKMYCAKTAGDTLNFVYVKKPSVPAATVAVPDPDVSVPSQLEASFIYQLAGLTMTAYKDEIATALFAISRNYLESPGGMAAGHSTEGE